MNAAAPFSLRILCLGASITAGYTDGGLAYHPYAKQLKDTLAQHLLHTRLEIDLAALNGDRVLGGQYLPRIKAHLARHVGKPPYDWIIIQGGGNDLRHGEPPEQVYKGLRRIWQAALSSGARVLALTITETEDRSRQTRLKYDAVNRMILDHREDGYATADVCSAIPWSKEDSEIERIWDDGLHFTPVGYDMLGDAIANRLVQLVLEPPLAKI